MNYLITGSKSFIGRNLIRYLKDLKIPFRSFKERSVDFKPDVLVHLSADTNVRESVKHPKRNFKKNTQKTFNMLQYCILHDIPKFVFASSAGVLDIRSPYLASKVAGEGYCTAFKNVYGLDISVLRFSNVYGPRSEYKDSIIANFIKAAIKNEKFYIYGSGDQTRDFIYVEDVAKAIVKSESGLATISSGQIKTINFIISYLSQLSYELIGTCPDIEYLPSNPGDIYKVKKSPSISKPADIKKSLRKTFKWFVKHL